MCETLFETIIAKIELCLGQMFSNSTVGLLPLIAFCNFSHCGYLAFYYADQMDFASSGLHFKIMLAGALMLRCASLLAILSDFFWTVSILNPILASGIDTSIFELDPSPL